jgi:hypothetical protein
VLGALRGSWHGGSKSEILEACEALSVEASEPRCRGPSGPGCRGSRVEVSEVRLSSPSALDSTESWCGRFHAVRGSQVLRSSGSSVR